MEKQIPLTHTKAQDYLIKGRNPLFIIYFVNPSIEFDEEVYSSDKTVNEEAREAAKLYRELQTRKYRYKCRIRSNIMYILWITKGCGNNEYNKIVDLFGGSGSTLIACEQLNRKCYMCELDPHYIDVIIQRWENFTGEKAIKLN